MKIDRRLIPAAIVAVALSSSVVSAAPRGRADRNPPPLTRLVHFLQHLFHPGTLEDFPVPPKP